MTVRAICFLTAILIFPFSSNAPNAAGFLDAASIGTEATVTEIILRAGNSDDEKTRYQMLRNLLGRSDLKKGIRKDLKILLPVIDDWANGREKMIEGEFKDEKDGYLSGFFDDYTRLENDFPGFIPENSPLYPIWCMYRGRFLLWVQIQYNDPETQDSYFREARRLLDKAKEVFPDNKILRMYLGEPIPWPAEYLPDLEAPLWARLQRDGLEKLTDVVYWWIDHRQLPDGQYGGRWDDDIEMWRWWAPLLIGFEDPKIIEAQLRLSRGILTHPSMKYGYTATMNDVEHAAENTADTLTPLMHLRPNDPRWMDRASRLAELMRTKWTGRNKQGFLQFKSTYFTVHKVDLNPKHTWDTVFHPRAIEPVLIYWQRSGDKTLQQLISNWMDTWVDAAAREERGKPSGILPSAIYWPEGRAGGNDKHWWKPEIYPNDLYAWPARMDFMTKTLMLTYHMTDDEKYLEPIRSMIRIHLHYKKNPPAGKVKEGSAAWCATTGGLYGNGMRSFLPETVAKYRKLTQKTDFDEILLASKISGYVKMLLEGDLKLLVRELEENAKSFRINKPVYTSEMRYTDRVLNYTDQWCNQGNGWAFPTPNIDLLYSTVTGDPGDYSYFPMNAVRWLTKPRQFAALVTASDRKNFEAQLYHFGDTAREMGAEFFLLKTGKYRMTLTGANGMLIFTNHVAVKGLIGRVSFVIPPQILCRLKLSPIGNID